MSPEPMLIDRPILNLEDAKQFLIELALGMHMRPIGFNGQERPYRISDLVEYDKRQYSSLRKAVNMVRDHCIQTRCTIQIHSDHAVIIEFEALSACVPAGVTVNDRWIPKPHTRYHSSQLRDFVAHVLKIAGEREYTHGGNNPP